MKIWGARDMEGLGGLKVLWGFAVRATRWSEARGFGEGFVR